VSPLFLSHQGKSWVWAWSVFPRRTSAGNERVIPVCEVISNYY
jgi:hypothetical protein